MLENRNSDSGDLVARPTSSSASFETPVALAIGVGWWIREPMSAGTDPVIATETIAPAEGQR